MRVHKRRGRCLRPEIRPRRARSSCFINVAENMIPLLCSFSASTRPREAPSSSPVWACGRPAPTSPVTPHPLSRPQDPAPKLKFNPSLYRHSYGLRTAPSAASWPLLMRLKGRRTPRRRRGTRPCSLNVSRGLSPSRPRAILRNLHNIKGNLNT